MCMRPWIRRYRFYWTFAPGGRLNYEAYNVAPVNFTFLITFKNDIYKPTLYFILYIQLYQLMTFANIIAFPNGILNDH